MPPCSLCMDPSVENIRDPVSSSFKAIESSTAVPSKAEETFERRNDDQKIAEARERALQRKNARPAPVVTKRK